MTPISIDPISGVSTAVGSTSCRSGTVSARECIVPSPPVSPTVNYLLCYSNLSYQTAFYIDATTGSSLYGYVTEVSGTAPNIDSHRAANGTSYTFAYDQYLSL